VVKEDERFKREAIMDLSDLLVSYGFSVEDAIKTSTDFWQKHRKKLKEAVAW